MKMTMTGRCATVAAALLMATGAAGDCEPGWDQSVGTPGANGWVYFIKTFEHQGTPHLHICGSFSQVNGMAANSVARYDGATWSALGAGFDQRVLTMAMYDSGNGPELYVGGAWTNPTDVKNIAKWNEAAQQWEQVGGGLDGGVIALAVYDDGNGPALYAGGDFLHADGKPASHIARWDGTSWEALGSGANDTVRAFIEFDDGTGPGLYIGGNFSVINGISAGRIIRYDGAGWTRLGAGLAGTGIRSMEVFDDGSGAQLYVGGVFTHAGGIPVANIARWDGKARLWSGMGGVNERIVIMRTFDDGDGAKLYIGGWFTVAGGQLIDYVGTWDGTSWSTLGSGANLVVRSMDVFDDGTGVALFVGGGFTQMNSQPSAGLARWTSCESAPVPGDVNGDGAVDVSDLLLLLAAWGGCPRGVECAADLNGDGMVDVSDLLLLLGNWE